MHDAKAKQSKIIPFEFMPLGLLSSVATMLLITLALYQKTKHFMPGMGTEAQEAPLSYPMVFRSHAPKYKIKFQLLLRLNI